MLGQVCGKHYDWFIEANWYLKYAYKALDYQKAKICKAAYEETLEACEKLYPNKAEVETGYIYAISAQLLFMIMAIGMGILNANEARSYN